MDSEARNDLIEEYITARLQEGDWSQDEEDMTREERWRHFRAQAEAMSDEQLIRTCNSYALAG